MSKAVFVRVAPRVAKGKLDEKERTAVGIYLVVLKDSALKGFVANAAIDAVFCELHSKPTDNLRITVHDAQTERTLPVCLGAPVKPGKLYEDVMLYLKGCLDIRVAGALFRGEATEDPGGDDGDDEETPGPNG